MTYNVLSGTLSLYTTLHVTVCYARGSYAAQSRCFIGVCVCAWCVVCVSISVRANTENLPTIEVM